MDRRDYIALNKPSKYDLFDIEFECYDIPTKIKISEIESFTYSKDKNLYIEHETHSEYYKEVEIKVKNGVIKVKRVKQ